MKVATRKHIIDQEINTSTLLSSLRALINSPAAQRQYQLLGCGHSIATYSHASAPAWSCPQCQQRVNQQRQFDQLAFIQPLTNTLTLNNRDHLLQKLTHIKAYFYKVEPNRAVRATDGRLYDSKHKQTYPGAFLPLTQDECTLMTDTRALIEQLIHALSQETKLVTAVPVQPIRDQDIAASLAFQLPEEVPMRIRYSIYRELKHFNEPAANASQIHETVKTHRAMIRSLRSISESTATLYAQSAHETLREKRKSPPDTNISARINACKQHESINNHCAISLDDFPEAPVYTDCGHSFNRVDIADWLDENDDCPCCRKQINTLTAIPVRSQINAALREENPTNALHALESSIKPFHIHWPYVVTTAVRNESDLNAELVWQRTPESKMDLSKIAPKINACIESVSHHLNTCHEENSVLVPTVSG